MNIDMKKGLEVKTGNIMAAWQECQQMFGDNLQLVPRVAHEQVLETTWLEDNSKKLARIYLKFMHKYDKLAIESFEGKLELKLPAVKYPEGMSNGDKAMVRHTVAALFIELLIDNGMLVTETKLTGKGKFTKVRTNVLFNGVGEEHDLLEGICVEPGEMIQTHVGHQRLSSDFKWMLSRIGSMAFKISDDFTVDMLQHGFKLSAEYNSESRHEKRVRRKFRHDTANVAAFNRLKHMSRFYMPMFFDDRGRLYYYFSRLFGVRPQGKLWETTAIDRYEPKLLDESAVKHIKHIIYTILHGKFSVDHAVRHFKASHWGYAATIDPMEVEVPDVPYKGNERAYRKAEQEFGERILLNKCAKALQMAENGEPCPYMFGKDLTNSGLIMAANSFRSEKMLRGANMLGLKKVADSHMQFGMAHKIEHLPRVEIKDIHTPLLHGSSVHTIVKKIQEHIDNPDDFNDQNVHEHNIDAYGVEVDNIDMIAEWGECVVSNHRNILKWKTPDGFPACHKAVMERTPFSVYAASTRVKSKPFKEYKLMATMPVMFDAKHQPVYGRENTTAMSDKGVNVKTRGLFANMTHSIDAYLLRWLINTLLEMDEVFLLKHDDYIISPDMFDVVIEVCQEFFSQLQEKNLYQDALEQIAEKLQCKAPKLYVGDAPNKVAESYNFLMV